MPDVSTTPNRPENVVYDDEIAAIYDNDSHGIYRASHDDILAMLPRDGQYQRIADVGVGTGTGLVRVVEALHPATIFGIDPSPAMLARAAERIPGLVRVDGGDGALVSDERLRDLDLVLANYVLAYSGPEKLIERARGALRPGGTLVVSTTTMNSFRELYSIASHPIFRVISSGYDIAPETAEANMPPVPRDLADLTARLEAGGMEVVDSRIRRHPMRFKNGRALYQFGREGGWWLDLYQRLGITERSVPWMHLAMRACQLLRLLDKDCTTSMETCTVIARRPLG